jgi:hypothetical protein
VATNDLEQVVVLLLAGVEPGVEELDHAVGADVLGDDELAAGGHRISLLQRARLLPVRR